MVHAVITATEVKTQVLMARGVRTPEGYAATGTSTDAIAVASTGRGIPLLYAGPVTLVGWLIAWIAGVVGDIGTGLQNQALENVGVVSHLVLPSDGLWRGAIYAMEPDTFIAALRALGTAGRANPFAATEPPPVSFLVWVVVWFALMLSLSIWSFRRREI